MEAEMLEVQSLPPYVEPFLQLSQGYFSEASHQLVKAALRVAVEKLDGMTRYDLGLLWSYTRWVPRRS